MLLLNGVAVEVEFQVKLNLIATPSTVRATQPRPTAASTRAAVVLQGGR